MYVWVLRGVALLVGFVSSSSALLCHCTWTSKLTPCVDNVCNASAAISHHGGREVPACAAFNHSKRGIMYNCATTETLVGDAVSCKYVAKTEFAVTLCWCQGEDLCNRNVFGEALLESVNQKYKEENPSTQPPPTTTTQLPPTTTSQYLPSTTSGIGRDISSRVINDASSTTSIPDTTTSVVEPPPSGAGEKLKLPARVVSSKDSSVSQGQVGHKDSGLMKEPTTTTQTNLNISIAATTTTTQPQPADLDSESDSTDDETKVRISEHQLKASSSTLLPFSLTVLLIFSISLLDML